MNCQNWSTDRLRRLSLAIRSSLSLRSNAFGSESLEVDCSSYADLKDVFIANSRVLSEQIVLGIVHVGDIHNLRVSP